MRDGARLVLGVAAVAFLLRLPFLDAGYGWDSDAWRVAAAAAAMAESGNYAAPRLPGNPVHDIFCALLWAIGPAARRPEILNGASALVTSLGAGALALAWHRRGLPDAALLGVAAASVPAVFIASVSTLDYAWGFAFIAAALAAATYGRVALAGAFAALAIGTRLSSGAAGLGVGLFFLLEGTSAGGRPDVRRFASFLAIAIGAGLLPYVPLFVELGPAGFRWYDHGYPALPLVLKKLTVDLWGWIGCGVGLAVVGAGVLGSQAGTPEPAPRAIPPAARASAATAAVGAALALVAFLRLPYKAAYLAPAVPLLLVAALAGLRRAPRRVVLVGLVLAPWLVSIYEPGKVDDPGPSPVAARVVVAGRAFIIDARGPILIDRVRRQEGIAYVARVAAAARGLAPGSVLVVQDWVPALRLALDRVAGPVEKDGVLYTHLLEGPELSALIAEGRSLWYLPGTEAANLDKYGVDLVAAGARPLAP